MLPLSGNIQERLVGPCLDGREPLTGFLKAREFVHQPRPRQFPIPHHSLRRDAEGLSGFFDAEAAKKAQFDYFGLPWIKLREGEQSIVKGDQFPGALRRVRNFVEIESQRMRDPLAPATALFCRPRSRSIYQDAPHQLRRNREEMGAVLPVKLAYRRQPQIGLVDQRGGLERMARPLAPHAARGKAAKFVMHQRC